MRTVNLAGIPCSALGFGCANLMGRVGRKQSLRALSLAFDCGVTLFDTARSYGWGESEALLGRFANGRRNRMTIVTKFGILPPPRRQVWNVIKPIARAALSVGKRFGLTRLTSAVRGQIANRVSTQVTHSCFDAATAKASVETSLKMLGTDYVDVLLMHGPSPSDLENDELLRLLEQFVSRGQVRALGVSSDAETAMRLARQLPLIRIVQHEHRDMPLQQAQSGSDPSIGLITNAPFRVQLGESQPVKSPRTSCEPSETRDRFCRLLRKAFACNPRGVVLCGMHSESHIRANVAVSNEPVLPDQK